MSDEYIQVRGYGKVHIDIILVGAKVNSGNFDYALKVSSEQRLRRIIGDLEAHPDGQLTRISKLKARLANLERMNAANAAYSAKLTRIDARVPLSALSNDAASIEMPTNGGE